MPALALPASARTAGWLGLALLLPPLGWWLLGPSGFAVELTERRWRMEIEVERLVLEPGVDRCDALPAQARDVVRRDGSDQCLYVAPAWRTRWVAQASGDASRPPQWPAPALKADGSERLGRRELFHEVGLRTGAGQVWTCRLPPERWARLQPGQRLRLPVDRWGTADCAALH